MKKLENIPTYYNSPGAPVFRDTTALPFKNGGNLDDPEYPDDTLYTWSGDPNSYYKYLPSTGTWEYLNNKTRDKWGRYDFQPVKNKKTIKKLNSEAVLNSAATETLTKWALQPDVLPVSPLVAKETNIKVKGLTFDERQALKQEYLSKDLPLPSWLSNIGAESLALYFNNVENMTSDQLYQKGMSMGPTMEGLKYIEMAKVQYENEQIKKANSMQKAISEGSGFKKGVMGIPTKKYNIEYTPIPLKPLPYAGQAGGKLITKDEKTAREFFDYLKNNKEAAQEIIGRELTEEELFNETGGYDNFAQTDLYQNFGNEKTIDKIEEQKYENFLEQNQEAKDEAGVVYNTLDFMRSLATDLPATTYNLFQGKMPLYQQSRGLGGEDPDTYNFYKKYTDAGGYGVLNALNDTWRLVAPVANAQDAVINFDKGNYGSSALLGLGALPLIGSAFKLPGLIKGASALNLTDDAARLAASGEDIVNAETAAASTVDNVANDATVANTTATTVNNSNEGWQSGVREIVDNADGSTTFHYNDGSSYVYPADINAFIAQRPANTRTLAQQMGLAESQGVIDLRRTGSTNVVDDAVENMSGYSKEKLLADKSLKLSEETKDAITKMSDEDFQNTVVKPDGTIVPYRDAPPSLEYNFDADQLMVKGSTPLTLDDYITQFNAGIPRLEEIIAANNKTGIPIKVNPLTAITSFGDLGALGKLSFSTPTLSNIRPNWTLGINPGKFVGEVEDFASTSYYKSLPGLSMMNTSAPVFSDFVPRRGSGVYKSINDYLKELELGRVKAGFNSQSEYSSGLWQDAATKGKAHGFFGKPGVVYGAMKTVAPVAVGGGAAGYLLNNSFDQSGYDAYGNMGLTTGTKSNAYGGPLNDRNINGKLLQSTYTSPLGNMFREGGPFGENKGTFDYANSIYASQPGNYYRTGGQFPRPYSLPEDSFKQGGNNLHNSVYASSNAQYPAIYKQGGNINVVAGGEKHRVYIKESPTGVGEGVKGHVMVTHPTMDKGKWDTIDLTVKARAKTIEQGIAATKKWHKENPNVYKQGGSVLSMSNTPQLQGEGKDLTYPDNAYIYRAGGDLIKRADGSYSQRGLWDNIRANRGSGKTPTKQMLQQEKKINKNYK
jgi:hypothetical protein